MKGTIIKGIGGFYYVDTKQGIAECRARGKFRKDGMLPMVGDTVEIELCADGSGSVKEIEERKNFLVRPAVSNVDLLVIVLSLSNPEPDTLLTDKMLINSAKSGIEGVLCLNKSDLGDDKKAQSLKDAYEKAGYRVFVTSAEKGEGVEELKAALRGKTAAFTGLSGVGKSSLLKLITGNELETGETSRIERGRHTTRRVELMKTPDGYVFDTPGFSQLEPDGIGCGQLREYFPEIWEREGLCRFRGCSHTAEPDCAVKKAAAEGEIAQSRYDSYCILYETLRTKKVDWTNKSRY